ncbi:MAG TPA: energy-coupling factor transporter transmembrane protein EcfT [Desulfurococcales archaeon]|nr:energy-coupling factor transporter transmembrane protein EcfT [Desulfurococcales archaeon]
MLWCLLIIVQLTLWTDPLWQLITLIVIVVPGVIAKTPWGKTLKTIKYILPVIPLLLIAEAILYPAENLNTPYAKRTLFTIGCVKASIGGFLFGLNLVEKIVFTIIFTSILTYTTPLSDILYLMQRLGLPSQIAFIIAVAWRLGPFFRRLYNEVMLLLKVRGLKVERGLIGKVKYSIVAFIPLYNIALDMIEKMALAMEIRAFGVSKKPTILREFKFTLKDYVVSAICILLTLISIVLSISGYGRL